VGYDAIGRGSGGEPVRYQIKGRCFRPGTSLGQRVGRIQPDKEWDAVLLVLLNENMDLVEILEAPRDKVIAELQKPGSRARNELGALGVQAFRRIAKQVWPRAERELIAMPQDRGSGAAGNAFGRETAPKIAAEIGARMLGTGSNEADWNGSRIVIKCARPGTTSVGVTKAMLDRIGSVVAAFQHLDGRYDVFEMSSAHFASLMRDSRSSGSAGRVGIVTHRDFKTHGRPIRTISALSASKPQP
jgi:uncharacterized protein with GYD domain